MRPRRRKKLTADELVSLQSDLLERIRLKSILAENSKEVLGVELGISEASVARMDGLDYAAERCPRIKPESVREVQQRRKIYWSTRAVYDPTYSTAAIMRRYGISKTTLARRLREVRRGKELETRYG